ncbi:MAG TPA: hypothetical protein VG742_01805 [Dongiaceae bacterium]|nr:hypothetical protein [Dongiaceae bacterium]
MSSKSASPKQPAKTGQVKTDETRAQDRKAERLAAALRDNLKRRKSQQRARDGAADGEPADGSGRSGNA